MQDNETDEMIWEMMMIKMMMTVTIPPASANEYDQDQLWAEILLQKLIKINEILII